MKKVLLAAYYFPPMASVSWMRVTKTAKYLPSTGWQPTVVSVSGGYYPRVVDGELPRELADMNVVRFRHFRWLPVLAVKLLFPLYVLSVAWNRRRELDVVVLYGSPFYPYLFAPLLRRVTGLNVVLDMRDSWSTAFEQHTSLRARLANAVRRAVERTGFGAASAVVFATQVLEQQYRDRFADLQHKFVTVTNGFDPDDFPATTRTENQGQQRILMAGKFLFYTPDVASWLLDLVAQQPQWHFRYIGEEAGQMRALVEPSPTTGISIEGYMPYRDVLKEVAKADLCIVSSSFQEGLGTKIFDYLALHKRVLCFVPATSEIINQFADLPGVTISAAPHSRESVHASLLQALASEPVDVSTLGRFTRERKAQEFARVLDQCA